MSMTEHTDIRILQDPRPGVRLTSGKTICVEELYDGRWLSRYWACDGRINFPYEYRPDDAFHIELNGEPVTSGWECRGIEESPETEKGARHVVAELSHADRGLDVLVHTLVDSTPVLTRWLEIRNTADKSVGLTNLSVWSGQLWAETSLVETDADECPHAFTLGHFTRSEQGYEGWLRWKPLPTGVTRVAGTRGCGHDAPFFLLRNEVKGQYFIAHLAWSANWTMEFVCRDDQVLLNEEGSLDVDGKPYAEGGDQTLCLRIGPAAVDALRVIAPGETVKTPAVHMGHIEGDLDTAAQAMHDHIREFVLPPRALEKSYLIQYPRPGDQGFVAERYADVAGQNEAKVLSDIDMAAELGMEVFRLDAGWWDVPGNWYPSPSRFPNGLQPIIDRTHDKGMLFGMYLEFERVNTWNSGTEESASDVAREHPDWIGPKCILDLSNPEAAAYAESELIRCIEEYQLDWYFLDFNPLHTGEWDSTERDGILENKHWRYYEAFYGIMERVQAKYPDLILQQAAAGGGRNDLGMVGCFHETYLTDGLEIPRVLQDYSGQTLAFPPEILTIGFGEGAHRNSGHFETHLRNMFTLATPLVFAVAPNLDMLTPLRRERYLRYVELYKTFIRPLLPGCRMYHHAPANARRGVEDGGWFAVEYASADGNKGWATIVRIGPSESDVYHLFPRGLDAGATYRVTMDNRDQTVCLDGWRLLQDGIRLRLEAVGSSELLLFEVHHPER